MSFGNEVS